MPVVSLVAGRIRIWQHYRDHHPAHFHAVDGDDEVLIQIADSAVIRGYMKPKSLAEVRNWADTHRAELALNWVYCQHQIRLIGIRYP